MPERPNILWITTDQQRYDTIAALGNPLICTPHVDRLVREGVSFTRAYCQSTVCAPSRASYLTGRYPRTTRCRQNGQMLPTSERLISRILADAGYTCGLAGKQHLDSCSESKIERRGDDGYRVFHWSHHPQPDWGEANAYTKWLAERGKTWDELYGGPITPYVVAGVSAAYHQTTWCAEMAIEFMREHRGSPWMFSVNCFDPHHPFDPAPEYLERYDPAQMPLPKYRTGELERKTDYQRYDHTHSRDGVAVYNAEAMTDLDRRQITAAYYAMVELIDDQVGRMLAALEETDQLDRTLVIFMSDHGEMLGDHGLYLKGPHFYEQAVRVPLVFRMPAMMERDLRVDGLVELVDLAPTLCEVAGLSEPEAMQGRSLMPLCAGEVEPDYWRDYVYCEYLNAWTHHRSYGTMMRTETEKIVVYHGIEDGELYDLEADPDEFENLYHDPAESRRALRHRLLKQAFDASVFTMDPMPPRLGAF